MSQIARSGVTTVIVTLTILLFGCGDPNDQSYFNADTGKHSTNWLPAAHMTAANANLTTCADCHGSDFTGGISQISCGLCHMGGATSMHPAGWLRDACFNHGGYVLNNGTAGCANVYCHGASLAGVSGSGQSCTKCHNPVPTSANCGGCHGIPPATGAHVVHTSTPLNYIVCGSCHASGCDKHNDGTQDVAISPVFYAKSAGTVAFNGTTCSKISCHGGQTTPNWTGGAINVNTQCTVCHAYGTGEYNSFTSGQHNKHVNQEGIACTQCHDTTATKLAVNHFTSLNTPAMEGPASATLLNSMNFNGTSCDPACHGQEDWR